MIDTEVQVKETLLVKLQREIEELQATKAQVVRDINVPVLESKAKAEAIIEEAKEEKKKIIDSAKKKKAEAEEYADSVRADASNTMAMAKAQLSEIELERVKLEDKMLDFDAHRVSIENAVHNKKVEADRIMSEAVKLRKESDELAINLEILKDTLNRKETDIIAREENVLAAEKNNEARKKELDQKEVDLVGLDQNIKSREKANKALEEELEKKTEAVRKETIISKRTFEEADKKQRENVKRSHDLDERSKSLDTMDENLKEQQRTIDTNMNLLNQKQREIDNKINVLNKLRKGEKNAVVS